MEASTEEDEPGNTGGASGEDGAAEAGRLRGGPRQGGSLGTGGRGLGGEEGGAPGEGGAGQAGGLCTPNACANQGACVDLGTRTLCDCRPGFVGDRCEVSTVAVAAGSGHSCTVRSDGSIACWGWNDHGQSTPPAGTFMAVAAGRDHSCALSTDGSIACWGDDEYGQSTPPKGTFTAVAAGARFSCAVRSDNLHVTCWGWLVR